MRVEQSLVNSHLKTNNSKTLQTTPTMKQNFMNTQQKYKKPWHKEEDEVTSFRSKPFLNHAWTTLFRILDGPLVHHFKWSSPRWLLLFFIFQRAILEALKEPDGMSISTLDLRFTFYSHAHDMIILALNWHIVCGNAKLIFLSIHLNTKVSFKEEKHQKTGVQI